MNNIFEKMGLKIRCITLVQKDGSLARKVYAGKRLILTEIVKAGKK